MTDQPATVIRAPKGQGKAHLSTKDPHVPAAYAGQTACGRWARGMTDTLPLADVAPADLCARCFPDHAPGHVPGHTLRHEGAPYADDGTALRAYPGYLNPGRGKCTCGALSPVTTSRNARKAWHRQHKADVAAQAAQEADQ